MQGLVCWAWSLGGLCCLVLWGGGCVLVGLLLAVGFWFWFFLSASIIFKAFKVTLGNINATDTSQENHLKSAPCLAFFACSKWEASVKVCLVLGHNSRKSIQLAVTLVEEAAFC